MDKRWYWIPSLLLLLMLGILPFSGNDRMEVLAQAGYGNPDCQLTDIDELTVSTKSSDGQASVIIFGKTDCGITQRIMKEIAKSEWVGRPDIRVVFVECNSASMEATKAFGQTYGCSDMIFCYDIYGNSNNRVWNEYCNIGDEMGVTIGPLPTTVLISEDNYVIKVLSGFQSAGSLYSEIMAGNSGTVTPVPGQSTPEPTVSPSPEPGAGMASPPNPKPAETGSSVHPVVLPGVSGVESAPRKNAVDTVAAPGSVNFRVSAKKGRAVLKWSKVKGATGYIVYYKTGKKASWKKLRKTKKTGYTKKKLKAGKRYYFTVKAYKIYGGKTYIGNGKTKKALIK